eukprot:TRINITY_DN13866_c0_g1_i1.p1 TRINITY_DN13866_c0_g1~~TRINITY_DN13866_c0_g1_i1.p1  ORF type:complete len:102 (+),score=18.36 TRINITY_DN13866_c0_g1_i1:90-395(+)
MTDSTTETSQTQTQTQTKAAPIIHTHHTGGATNIHLSGSDSAHLSEEQFIARFGHARPKAKLLHSPRKYFDSADWTMSGSAQTDLPHRPVNNVDTTVKTDN